MRQQQIKERIRLCEQRSNYGLWALALFVAISIAANCPISHSCGTGTGVARASRPPPTHRLDQRCPLRLQLFCGDPDLHPDDAGDGTERDRCIPVIYLVLFYLFYGASGALIEHFWAVLAAGITILGLESYSCWNYYQTELRDAREELDRLDRLEKLS